MTTAHKHLCAALRARFGSRKYKITKISGMVSVFGPYPNGMGSGWYFFGFAADINPDHV